jgi:hypothetical protein
VLLFYFLVRCAAILYSTSICVSSKINVCVKFCFLLSKQSSCSARKKLDDECKVSVASRSIIQDFLDSVRALAWVELECYIRFLSGGKLVEKFVKNLKIIFLLTSILVN